MIKYNIYKSKIQQDATSIPVNVSVEDCIQVYHILEIYVETDNGTYVIPISNTPITFNDLELTVFPPVPMD